VVALRRPLVVILAIALAAAGSGCGKNKEEEADARRAVNQLYRALGAKDADKVCDLLSRQGRRELARAAQQSGGERQSCESLFEFALTFSTGLERTADSKVTDISVSGDEARAKVKNRREEGDVLLVKEDGAWKLSGLGLD